ncbi:MAG: zinc ABC transporter substrate-binding protein [Chloroflexi bacterium]|nr:zinc ABC transporter substrate-binding protein [Chloroflexota bacterium]
MSRYITIVSAGSAGLDARSRRSRAVLLLALASVMSACGSGSGADTADKLQIAVSIPILADVVRGVAAESATVWSVVPATRDVHTYEARPSDIARLASADLYIEISANLERFTEAGAWRRALDEAKTRRLVLAGRLELIAVDRVIDHGDHVHDLRGGDPHVWLDPAYVRQIVAIVRDELALLDPEHKLQFADRADRYLAELTDLEEELDAGIAQIPASDRRLVVFHDAYTYFARRYKFEVIGLVIRSPGAEPSALEIAELVDVIKQANVRVVFREPQFKARVLDQLAADLDLRVGELMTDTFTDEVGTYLELMRFNMRSLVVHLTTTAS